MVGWWLHSITDGLLVPDNFLNATSHADSL